MPDDGEEDTRGFVLALRDCASGVDMGGMLPVVVYVLESWTSMGGGLHVVLDIFGVIRIVRGMEIG